MDAIKYLQKADEQGSARKYGRSTKKSVDRPTLLTDGKKTGPMASCLGRCVEGWPSSHPRPSEAKTQVLGPQLSTKQTS